MNRHEDYAIIRTLCRSGHETLAKAFARSRGYRVSGSSVPYATVLGSLYRTDDAGNVTLDEAIGMLSDHFHTDQHAEDLMLPSLVEARLNRYADSFYKARGMFGLGPQHARAYQVMSRLVDEALGGGAVDYGLATASVVTAAPKKAPKKSSKKGAKELSWVEFETVVPYVVRYVGEDELYRSAKAAREAGFTPKQIGKAARWMYDWLEGDSPKVYKGLREIMEAFSIKKGSVSKLYRGMAVPTDFAKFRGNQRPLASIVQQNPTSWSTKRSGARDPEFYKDPGIGKMGILLSAKFSPDQTIVNFTRIPWYSKTKFKDEHEVLIVPGTFKTNVENVMMNQPNDLHGIGLLPPWLEGLVNPKK
jgi:hypothetical protein